MLLLPGQKKVCILLMVNLMFNQIKTFITSKILYNISKIVLTNFNGNDNYMTYAKKLLTTKIQPNGITALFMGQTDLDTGLWFPIKKMTWKYLNGEYLDLKTVFTHGAEKLKNMYPEKSPFLLSGNLKRISRSNNISACPWRNRMPINRQPDPSLFSCLGLSPNPPYDPISYVSRSGGYRYGDTNDLFPEILPDPDGDYHFIFRPVDSYVFTNPNQPELETITEGEIVTPQLVEAQIKLSCQSQIIGIAPGYIRELIKKYQEQLSIKIYQVNYGLPLEYQFLCQATLNQNSGIPFTELEYQPQSV